MNQADYSDLIEQLSEKTERFHLLEGSNRDQKIEQVLMGLGFTRPDFARHTREFSGGWRMRIELAKILLNRPMWSCWMNPPITSTLIRFNGSKNFCTIIMVPWC